MLSRKLLADRDQQAKARGILGYEPRHSVFDMVDEAIQAKRAGDHASPGAETH